MGWMPCRPVQWLAPDTDGRSSCLGLRSNFFIISIVHGTRLTSQPQGIIPSTLGDFRLGIAQAAGSSSLAFTFSDESLLVW